VKRSLPFARYEAFLAMTMTSAVSTISTWVMTGSSETSVSATLQSVTKQETRTFLDFFFSVLVILTDHYLRQRLHKRKSQNSQCGTGENCDKTQAKQMARGEKGTQIIRPHYLEMGL
jgi:hypothetical protein